MNKPSVKPPVREATIEDLLAAPEHMVAEIIDGVLYTHPRPRPRHARSSSALGMVIGGPYDQGSGGGPGGWWIIDEPELHLGKQVVVPDIAGWRRERMPKLPETAWFGLAPDWVCEVLSPSTAQLDRVQKRRINAEHGVSHLWFIDPEARTLEAFELRGSQWLLIETLADDAEVAVSPFAAVPFQLDVLWAD